MQKFIISDRHIEHMVTYFNEFMVRTNKRKELIDITNEVELKVRDSGIREGICLVHTPHSTAAIIVNEHESGLMNDIIKKVGHDFPRGAGWMHDLVDDNADAHLASIYLGPCKLFPVKEGKLIRGTWQNIFLLELDGPRIRRVLVEVIG